MTTRIRAPYKKFRYVDKTTGAVLYFLDGSRIASDEEIAILKRIPRDVGIFHYPDDTPVNDATLTLEEVLELNKPDKIAYAFDALGLTLAKSWKVTRMNALLEEHFNNKAL